MPTPTTQPVLYLENPYTSLLILYPNMKDWEDDLSPQTLDHCLQSSEIPFDSFQVALFINGVHMEEQQMVIAGCVDKIQQSFHDISDSSPCQATYPSRSDQQMGASVPCSRESPTTITHHFFQVIMHGTGSIGSVVSLTAMPSYSSAWGGTKPVHQLQSSGRARAFLLILGVTSFQSSSSTNFWLTILHSTEPSCLSTAMGVETPEAVHYRRIFPCSSSWMLHSLLISSCNSLTWQNNSSTTTHLQKRWLSAPDSP